MAFEIKFKGKKLSHEEVLIYAGCALALIAMLLPWVTFGAMSANGFRMNMWFFLLPLGFSLYQLKNKTKFAKEKNITTLIELSPAIISAIATFVFIADKQRVVFRKSVNFASTGCYIFIIACAVVGYGAYLNSKKIK
jgi:hypothetical protein